MINKLNHTKREVAKAILEVQLPSYKVEAELIGFWELPPLKETVADIQQSNEEFYGFYEEKLCGVISVQMEQEVLEICRLVVHPEYFRQGIAKQLLTHIQNHLREFSEISVATGTDNLPAVRFYEANGFFKVKQTKTKEGLSIVLLNKEI